MLALKNKVEGEEHFLNVREVKRRDGEMGVNAKCHGPMDYRKTLELQFRMGTWTCQKRERYTSSWEE